MLLKNVKVKRPSSTKIQSRNGIDYVYQVTEKIYHKDKKYTTERRMNIGKMMDSEYMIPNENFAQFYPDVSVDRGPPQFSDTLKVGAFLLIQKLMKDLQLQDLLESVFENHSLFIQDIVSYILCAESCTFQYYPTFMHNHPILEEAIRDDTQICRLLKKTIDEDDIELFLKGWNQIQNIQECIYLGYDSTNMNTYASGIELADYGHPKVDEGLPQFNLSYMVSQEDSTPLFYELYEGSIIDNTQLVMMVEKAQEYGYKKVGLLLDRGYISEKNLIKMRSKGYEFILMLKQNQKICQELIQEYGAVIRNMEGFYLSEQDVCGCTVQKKLYGEMTNIHIYYDDGRASEEKRALLNRYSIWEKELDKKIEKKTVTEEKLKKYAKFN